MRIIENTDGGHDESRENMTRACKRIGQLYASKHAEA